VISTFLPRLQVATKGTERSLATNDQDTDDSDSEAGEPTERTPLVSSTESTRNPTAVYAVGKLSPVLLAAVLGLFICLVKPIQHALIGHNVREGDFTGSWRGIGFGLTLLGASFAVVDLLADGMSVRAGEKKAYVLPPWSKAFADRDRDEEKVPPTLGTTLVVVFWRFIAVPALVLAIVYGLRKIPSTTAYLQDPAFVGSLACRSS
jgi:hypothetical protein